LRRIRDESATEFPSEAHWQNIEVKFMLTTRRHAILPGIVFFCTSLLFTSLLTSPLFARNASSQGTSTQTTAANQGNLDQDIQLMRKDIRSQKKQIIAANLKLTDAEAEKFWPVYDQYTAELVKINDTKYASLNQYVNNFETISGDQAMDLSRNIVGVDASVAQLRERYMPLFAKVISPKKTALFFQMDRLLVMMIDVQLTSALPIAQP
jgi:hypothetical protein